MDEHFKITVAWTDAGESYALTAALEDFRDDPMRTLVWDALVASVKYTLRREING